MTQSRLCKDPAVDRLRWVMLLVMLAGIALTLAGQPPVFWSHPDAAIRGDGLGIHNATNHSFEFLLGHGWAAYLACSAAYVAVTFLLVSALPRRIALILLFTVILGHIYGGTNWLAVRWHGGMLASPVYTLGVGIPLAAIVGQVGRQGPELNRRLGWIAAAALLTDMTCTLLGQPNSYWSNPATAYEGNVVSRYFLVHGWGAFAAYDVVYALVLYLLVTKLPRGAGLAVAFFFAIVGFVGASNWLFFVWRDGMAAVLAYACLFSAALVALVFELKPQKSAPIAATSP
jgi:hypothetical protein